MNWMTSGRHRALRSKRGKQRCERRFPAHVEREQQRVRRHPLASAASAAAAAARSATNNGDGTAWYIRTIMDANESHDIQMLELGREAALGPPSRDDQQVKKPEEAAAQPLLDEGEVQRQPKGSIASKGVVAAVPERRCVFTPVKAKRARSHGGAGMARQVRPRAASPPPKDIVFFNEGEELAKSIPKVVSPRRKKIEAPNLMRWEETSNAKQTAITQDVGARGEQDALPFYAASSSEDESTRNSNAVVSTQNVAAIEHRISTKYSPRPHARTYRLHAHGQCDHALQAERGFLRQIQNQLDANCETSAMNHRSYFPASTAYPEDDSQHSLAPSSRQSVTKTKQGPSFPHFNQSHGVFLVEQVHMARNSTPAGDHGSQSSDDNYGGPTGMDEDNGAEQKSTSSQESLVLPPPADWTKQLDMRSHRTQWTNNLEYHQEAEHRRQDSGEALARDNVQLNYVGCGGSYAKSWTMTRRTRAILAHSPRKNECSTAPRDCQVVTLKRQRNQEATNIYLFILIQCYRIDERLRAAKREEGVNAGSDLEDDVNSAT